MQSEGLEVRNTGERAGAYVAQLYLVSRDGSPLRRLVAFRRVELAPGEKRRIELEIDPRLLADWRDGRWVIPAGEYRFAPGENAAALGNPYPVRLQGRNWQ